MKTSNATELQRIATDLVSTLNPRDAAATIVTLSGELGAGKTTFVQGIAKTFGVTETVSSPTFVIEKIYTLKCQPFDRLIHIDAYRLKHSDELLAIGWEEITSDPKNLILLEWPERVPEVMPKEAIRVRIDIDGEARIISIDGHEEDAEENS